MGWEVYLCILSKNIALIKILVNLIKKVNLNILKVNMKKL